MMKDDDFKLLRGFDYGQTDRITDICECRVTFATEKQHLNPSIYLRLVIYDFHLEIKKTLICVVDGYQNVP